jgi:hypothetical protein
MPIQVPRRARNGSGRPPPFAPERERVVVRREVERVERDDDVGRRDELPLRDEEERREVEV